MIAFDQPIGASTPARHERAVAVLVNQERGKRRLPPLLPSRSLRRSARRWALVQTRLSHFGHGDFGRRAFAFPFVLRGRPGTRSVGENLAWGVDRTSTPRRIVQAWMASPSHRATLLGNWRYTAVVSLADAPMPGLQTSGVMVVQHFGR
jgi:uncharacterized protein YkwD